MLLNINEKYQAIKYNEYENKPKNSLSRFVGQYAWILKYFGFSLPSKNIYNVLIESNWHIVYQDNVSMILEK